MKSILDSHDDEKWSNFVIKVEPEDVGKIFKSDQFIEFADDYCPNCSFGEYVPFQEMNEIQLKWMTPHNKLRLGLITPEQYEIESKEYHMRVLQSKIEGSIAAARQYPELMDKLKHIINTK